MADDTLSPGTLWMMGTRVVPPNPTPEFPDVPILTLLMYKFCNGDAEKFEELSNLMDDAFEAGRRYDLGVPDLIIIERALEDRSEHFKRSAEFENPAHTGYKNCMDASKLILELKQRLKGIRNVRKKAGAKIRT